MFFSKVFLLAIVVGALSVFATPHALQHHALHRRAVAARVAASVREASPPNNATVGRQNSPKCSPHSSSAESATVLAAGDDVEPVISSQPSPPASTTSSSPALAPSSTPSPTPSPSPSPTPSPSPSPSPTTTPPASSPAGSGSFSGDGTFFQTGLGACGVTNVDTDYICAVSEALFDSFPGYNGVNPNSNPVCGRKIQIDFGGKSITVTVEDRCAACKLDDLDLTPSAFAALADLSLGRIEIQWKWLE